MMKNYMSLTITLADLTLAACSPFETPVVAEDHFHPKGKAPSEFTLEVFEKARETLPFSDRQDFEEMEKGFIARPESMQIMGDAGHVAWDMERYLFLLEKEEIDSIHPSLLRQSQLNMNFGLYEVIPGIYQVRGFDLSNISCVRGRTGWIVFDPSARLPFLRSLVACSGFCSVGSYLPCSWPSLSTFS